MSVEAGRLGLLPPGLESAELARRYALFAVNFRAIEQYSGGSCAAPLVLFRAAEAPAAEALVERDLGWSRLARGPIKVCEIPGDHYTLLNDGQAEILASHLRGRLTA
jgi:thioesterase domain-containing protein